jgi:hypothetical protein
MAKPADRLAAVSKDSVGLALQPVLSERVNLLLAWARASGRKWDRRDVVASLVFASPKNKDDFEELIKRYEEATVADARIKGQRDAQFAKRPGRVPAPIKGMTR